VTPLADLLQRVPLRPPLGGKDESGTVLVVGGPPTCPGAALLCATAALRVGAGRVQVVVHPDVAAACAASAWELLVDAWDQQSPPPPGILRRVGHADAVVIGPGHHALDPEVVAAVVEAAESLVVLDAGALGAVAHIDGGTERLVLAPNTSEAAALARTTGDEPALAKALVDQLQRPVAVRGPCTVVADPTGAWRFDDPPPGLGTPGSGDVLIGIVAGLLASGCSDLAALGWAVHLHAAAGARCAEQAPVGYLASELCAALPGAIAAALG
jgi:hydroxyethylthiazole kinase-like uncharacterized protein yjeF